MSEVVPEVAFEVASGVASEDVGEVVKYRGGR